MGGGGRERFKSSGKWCGDVGGGGGDGEELEALAHLLWTGQHFIATEQLFSL